MDQYGVAQRRLQAMQQELEEMRANMEAVWEIKWNHFCSSLLKHWFIYTTGPTFKARCWTVGRRC
jgi:hypothetical protein